MQAVAGENRLGFTESLVQCRLAPPKVCIVHAWKVVVDERVNVDRLDRAADAQRACPIDREKARGGDRQEGPEPLAPADRGMAHRFEEPVTAVASGGKVLPEELVDIGANPRAFRLQLLAEAVDRLNRHRTA